MILVTSAARSPALGAGAACRSSISASAASRLVPLTWAVALFTRVVMPLSCVPTFLVAASLAVWGDVGVREAEVVSLCFRSASFLDDGMGV